MALPVIEICPKNNFFDYEAKYTEGKCEEIVPARLNDEITKKIQEYSLKVFGLTGARGFIRVDFMVFNSQFYFGELTKSPASGFVQWQPAEKDLEFGSLLDLTM